MPAILDAVRAHRTVVYGRDGRAYGDPECIRLAAERPELRDVAATDARAGWLDWLSSMFGALGLIGLVAIDRRGSLT